jgi:hypothetical protein
VQERITACLRDVLTAPDSDIDEHMRAVATHALRIPVDVVAVLNAEKQYRTAMQRWDSYKTWQRQRNPARAELERTHGYDTKHAMHLIRLMTMGLEILEGGVLRVRRTNAAELSAIRDGSLSFEELLARAARFQEAMECAAATTTLPDDVDREAVDELALRVMSAESK